MSIWMAITVTLNEKSKVSVRRAAESVWGRDEIFVNNIVHYLDNHGYQSYEVRLCREGVDELDNLKTFLHNIKEHDPHCNVVLAVDNLNLY